MPRALEPGVEISIVLDSDREKPAETQPRFFYRALSGREWRQAGNTSDAIENAKTTDEAMDRLYAAVCVGLVRWENMNDPKTGEPIPFKPENIDLLIDPYEARELLEKVMQSGRLSADDKKKSDSSPSSNSAS